MVKSFDRTRRVGEQIRRELAQLLREEVKDPRLGGVTLNAVQVSKDLGHAKVYYTILGEQVQRSEVARGLERASGFLRGELGRRLSLRVTPSLRFYFDESVERGAHLSELIDRAVSEDSRHHQTAPPANDKPDQE